MADMLTLADLRVIDHDGDGRFRRASLADLVEVARAEGYELVAMPSGATPSPEEETPE